MYQQAREAAYVTVIPRFEGSASYEYVIAGFFEELGFSGKIAANFQGWIPSQDGQQVQARFSDTFLGLTVIVKLSAFAECSGVFRISCRDSRQFREIRRRVRQQALEMRQVMADEVEQIEGGSGAERERVLVIPIERLRSLPDDEAFRTDAVKALLAKTGSIEGTLSNHQVANLINGLCDFSGYTRRQIGGSVTSKMTRQFKGTQVPVFTSLGNGRFGLSQAGREIALSLEGSTHSTDKAAEMSWGERARYHRKEARRAGAEALREVRQQIKELEDRLAALREQEAEFLEMLGIDSATIEQVS